MIKNKVFLPFKVLIYLFLSIVLIFMLGYSLDVKLHPEKEVPDFLGYSPLLVVSGSMEPYIMTNDIIIIKKASYQEAKINDVVVYTQDKMGIRIIHRLLEIDENGMAITKGDANYKEDEPFPAKKIIGIYKFKIPYIGKFIAFKKDNPQITPILYFLIIILFLLDPIINLIKKRTHDLTNKQK